MGVEEDPVKELHELTKEILREYMIETYVGAPEDIEAALEEKLEYHNLEDRNTESKSFALLERTLKETGKIVYQVYSFKWIGLGVGHACPCDLHFIGLYNSLEEAQKKIDEIATPEYVKKYNLKFKIPPHQKAYPMIFIEGIDIRSIIYHECGDLFPEILENPKSKFADNYKDKIILYKTQGSMRMPTVKRISATKPLEELPELVRKKVSEHLHGTGLDLKLLEL